MPFLPDLSSKYNMSSSASSSRHSISNTPNPSPPSPLPLPASLAEDEDGLVGGAPDPRVDGELILWKSHVVETGETWKVHKTLSFHRKDVLDLEWSKDSRFLLSGSVDNSCIIWDINKGSVSQIWDGHFHYVLGVAWDPLSKFVASTSSHSTCRIYANKALSKGKGVEKPNYVCQHVICKTDPQGDDVGTAKSNFFHDETLPSFFRRLAWAPDGSFLLAPAEKDPQKSGFSLVRNEFCQVFVEKLLSTSVVNTALGRIDLSSQDLSSFFSISKASVLHLTKYHLPYGHLNNPSEVILYPEEYHHFSNSFVLSDDRPAIQLPGASTVVVACRFCPAVFSLRRSNPDGFLKLPYRLVFALATLNSLYIYDTESVAPIVIMSGIQYAAISDIAWSPDARFLALSSQDGYCTLLEFENDELGSPISSSEEKMTRVDQTVSDDDKQEDMLTDATPDSTLEPQRGMSQEVDITPSTARPSAPKDQSKRRITPMAIS